MPLFFSFTAKVECVDNSVNVRLFNEFSCRHDRNRKEPAFENRKLCKGHQKLSNWCSASRVQTAMTSRDTLSRDNKGYQSHTPKCITRHTLPCGDGMLKCNYDSLDSYGYCEIPNVVDDALAHSSASSTDPFFINPTTGNSLYKEEQNEDTKRLFRGKGSGSLLATSQRSIQADRELSGSNDDENEDVTHQEALSKVRVVQIVLKKEVPQHLQNSPKKDSQFISSSGPSMRDKYWPIIEKLTESKTHSRCRAHDDLCGFVSAHDKLSLASGATYSDDSDSSSIEVGETSSSFMLKPKSISNHSNISYESNVTTLPKVDKSSCSSPTNSSDSGVNVSLANLYDSGVSLVSCLDSGSVNVSDDSSDGGSSSSFDEASMVSIAVDDMISSAFEKNYRGAKPFTKRSECYITVNGKNAFRTSMKDSILDVSPNARLMSRRNNDNTWTGDSGMRASQVNKNASIRFSNGVSRSAGSSCVLKRKSAIKRHVRPYFVNHRTTTSIFVNNPRNMNTVPTPSEMSRSPKISKRRASDIRSSIRKYRRDLHICQSSPDVLMNIFVDQRKSSNLLENIVDKNVYSKSSHFCWANSKFQHKRSFTPCQISPVACCCKYQSVQCCCHNSPKNGFCQSISKVPAKDLQTQTSNDSLSLVTRVLLNENAHEVDIMPCVRENNHLPFDDKTNVAEDVQNSCRHSVIQDDRSDDTLAKGCVSNIFTDKADEATEDEASDEVYLNVQHEKTAESNHVRHSNNPPTASFGTLEDEEKEIENQRSLVISTSSLSTTDFIENRTTPSAKHPSRFARGKKKINRRPTMGVPQAALKAAQALVKHSSNSLLTNSERNITEDDTLSENDNNVGVSITDGGICNSIGPLPEVDRCENIFDGSDQTLHRANLPCAKEYGHTTHSKNDCKSFLINTKAHATKCECTVESDTIRLDENALPNILTGTPASVYELSSKESICANMTSEYDGLSEVSEVGPGSDHASSTQLIDFAADFANAEETRSSATVLASNDLLAGSEHDCPKVIKNSPVAQQLQQSLLSEQNLNYCNLAINGNVSTRESNARENVGGSLKRESAAVRRREDSRVRLRRGRRVAGVKLTRVTRVTHVSIAFILCKIVLITLLLNN